MEAYFQREDSYYLTYLFVKAQIKKGKLYHFY